MFFLTQIATVPRDSKAITFLFLYAGLKECRLRNHFLNLSYSIMIDRSDLAKIGKLKRIEFINREISFLY